MAAAPPPCHRVSTLPTLMEELVEEILLRIPPEEPAHLVRAALVCKAWRRIILSDGDAGFLHRYHEFHRRRPPPLLGFFYNEFGKHDIRPSFKPAAAAFPPLADQFRRRAQWIYDCRHGRVLSDERSTMVVWDPISDNWLELPSLGMVCESYCFSVLCAVAGCDHHDCRGGPFLVVFLGGDEYFLDGGGDGDDDPIFKVCVYSSEDHAWGTPVSYQLLDSRYHIDIRRATVIGEDIYCAVTLPPDARIIKYDLVTRCISSFSSPRICREAPRRNWSMPIDDEAPVLMQNEDGSLGLAVIRKSRLYVWSLSRMAVNQDGKSVAEWIQERAIELDKILSSDMYKHYTEVHVAGFAEGVGVLFIRTSVDTFTFELSSGRVRKIAGFMRTIFPFVTFFTPLAAT